MKTKKLLAYYLSNPDIGAHFYESAPDSVFCPSCGTVTDKRYIPSKIKCNSSRGKLLDIGATYDGQEICSQRFKDFSDSEGLEIDFYEIDMGKLVYHFRPRQIVKYDTLRRKTRFIKPCLICGNHAEVIGSIPVYFLDIFEPLQDGIYRTDVEFGSAHHKGFEVIVGLSTREKMVAQKFRGCTLMPIYLEETLH
jgi:hypothetical protein